MRGADSENRQTDCKFETGDIDYPGTELCSASRGSGYGRVVAMAARWLAALLGLLLLLQATAMDPQQPFASPESAEDLEEQREADRARTRSMAEEEGRCKAGKRRPSRDGNTHIFIKSMSLSAFEERQVHVVSSGNVQQPDGSIPQRQQSRQRGCMAVLTLLFPLFFIVFLRFVAVP